MPHLRVISFEQLTNLRDLLCDLQVLLTRYRRRVDEQHKLSFDERRLWVAQMTSVASHLFHRVREVLPAETSETRSQRMQSWEDAFYFGDRIAKPLPSEMPAQTRGDTRGVYGKPPGPEPHDPDRRDRPDDRRPTHLDPEAAFKARLLLCDAQSLISDYELRNDPRHQLSAEQRQQWAAEAAAVLAAMIRSFELYCENARSSRLIDVPLAWQRQMEAGERLATEKDTPAKREMEEIKRRYQAQEARQRGR